MTHEEATRKLAEISTRLDDPTDHYDQDQGHREADGVLLSLLEECGFRAVVEAYEVLQDDFWYS